VATLQVFDKPMCCSTGICGPKVDPVLPKFAADLARLKDQGVAVERYNLAQQPQAFVAHDDVKDAIREDHEHARWEGPEQGDGGAGRQRGPGEGRPRGQEGAQAAEAEAQDGHDGGRAAAEGDAVDQGDGPRRPADRFLACPALRSPPDGARRGRMGRGARRAAVVTQGLGEGRDLPAVLALAEMSGQVGSEGARPRGRRRLRFSSARPTCHGACLPRRFVTGLPAASPASAGP
jgi:hypothetical protein